MEKVYCSNIYEGREEKILKVFCLLQSGKNISTVKNIESQLK